MNCLFLHFLSFPLLIHVYTYSMLVGVYACFLKYFCLMACNICSMTWEVIYYINKCRVIKLKQVWIMQYDIIKQNNSDCTKISSDLDNKPWPSDVKVPVLYSIMKSNQLYVNFKQKQITDWVHCRQRITFNKTQNTLLVFFSVRYFHSNIF